MTAQVQQSDYNKAFVPPLESWDRLTRYEFERRYNAMPHIKKAELIEGVVYVVSHCVLTVMENHTGILWVGCGRIKFPPQV